MKPAKKPVRSFAACDGAGMTLEEIAAELGVTHQAVAQSLRGGLNKIRRHPETVERFAELVKLHADLQRRKEIRDVA